MSGKMVLETGRLLLREYVAGDAAATFELGSNAEVQRYTRDPLLTSIDQAQEMLLRHPIADYRKHGFGRWAVVCKADGRLIGFAGLKYLDELREVDVGYRLLPEYWGRGLATEAVRASVQYGFETLKLSRIIGLVDPENTRSVRVLEKSGLAFEKMIDYGSHQVALYAIHNDSARQALRAARQATPPSS
ncbi:MAG TPA: GNAT family N-acetyltransferase [Planctomycetaceae bacterium]|jgi:RimJ/RimL family protein N-acetyltransferase